MYKNRQVFLTLHWWQEGQSLPDIFTHPPGSPRRHLGFGIFLKDAMTGWLREPWMERRPLYMYNCHLGVNCCADQLWKHRVWDSSVGLRGVIVGNKPSWQVMTSLQSGSCWRLWAADKCGAACECQACSCVGGNGAHVDGKVRTHTGVQIKMCTQKISGSPQMLPHWAVQQYNN